MSEMTLLSDIKLRFNIDHPGLEECYLFGYECALVEAGEEENPYAAGTEEHYQWMEGWWAGFYGDTPLFNLEEIAREESSQLEIAANDQSYHAHYSNFLFVFLKITGAIAATALVGYQVFDLVA